MKIGIIGATGKAGQAVYAEAVKRGHETTAIVRNPQKAREMLGADVVTLHKDAFALGREDLTQFEVIVDAFSTGAAQAYLHIDLAARIVGLLRATTTPRVIFILGCGSLMTGTDQHLVVEELREDPSAAEWIAIPENQLKELRFLQGVDNVQWVGVSPSMTFPPGEASGVVVGGDELLIAPDGVSRVTTGTMAVAILDEIEHPAHHRQRFTVRDA
jgi:putative NADH-flavin reductase